MITRFQKLFQVEIWHDYYGGPSFDFTFLVPLETAEQLRNGRLIAKCHDGRLAVFFAAKEGAEPCVFLAGRRLDFALRLTNPDFPNFTKPDGNATREAYTVPRFLPCQGT